MSLDVQYISIMLWVNNLSEYFYIEVRNMFSSGVNVTEVDTSHIKISFSDGPTVDVLVGRSSNLIYQLFMPQKYKGQRFFCISILCYLKQIKVGLHANISNMCIQ